MKFAVEYNQYTRHKGVTSELLDEVNEIIITWNPKDSTLYEFLLLYKNKKININIISTKDYIEYKLFEQLNKIKEENPEMEIVLVFNYNTLYIEGNLNKILEPLKNSKLKYAFQEIVISWETFNVFIEQGVSEIQIGNELCFNLEKCYKLASAHNILLKTDIGVAHKMYGDLISDYQSFFIRPDDIEKYAEYIDTFILSTNTNIESLNTLYEIFAKDKT